MGGQTSVEKCYAQSNVLKLKGSKDQTDINTTLKPNEWALNKWKKCNGKVYYIVELDKSFKDNCNNPQVLITSKCNQNDEEDPLKNTLEEEENKELNTDITQEITADTPADTPVDSQENIDNKNLNENFNNFNDFHKNDNTFIILLLLILILLFYCKNK